MKSCWVGNPKNRPNANDIIQKVCPSPTQQVMSVTPISIKPSQSFCQVVAITPSNFSNADVSEKDLEQHFSKYKAYILNVSIARSYHDRCQSELWVCCEDKDAVAKISVYNTHSMTKVGQHFIDHKKVQSMTLSGSHIWIASKSGSECHIDAIDIGTGELTQLHKIHLQERSVTCTCITPCK